VAVFDSLLPPHEAFDRTSHRALGCKAAGDAQGMEAAMTGMFRLSVTRVDRLMRLDLMRQGKGGTR